MFYIPVLKKIKVSFNSCHCNCIELFSYLSLLLYYLLQPKQFTALYCISHTQTLYFSLSHCNCIELFSTAKAVLCVHTLYLSLLLYYLLQPKQFCVFTHCISHCYCIELFSTAKPVLCVHTLYLSLLLYRVVFYSQRCSVCSHTVSLTVIVLSCFLHPNSSVCSHTVSSLLLYRVVF